MTRTVIAILAGLLVAALIGFVINILLVAVGSTLLSSAPVIGLSLGGFVALGLMRSGGRKVAPKADARERAAALASPPPAGKTRLIPFREGAMGSRNGSDVSINGQEAVQLLGGRFVVLTLAPGASKLRVALAGAANAGSKLAEKTVDLAERETTVFRVTLAMKMTTSDIVLTAMDLAAATSRLSAMTMVKGCF